MSSACVASSAPGWATQPPPGEITAGGPASALPSPRAPARGSRSRRARPKIRLTGIRIFRTMMLSVSTNAAPRLSATSRPTVVFPAPGRPTSTNVRFIHPPRRAPGARRGPPGRERCEVAVIVAPQSRPASRRRTSPASRRPAPARSAPRRSRPAPAPRSRRSARSGPWPACPVARSTVGSGDIRVEIGFIATRMTSGSPVVIPPSSPPALLLRRAKPPRSAAIGQRWPPGTASASIGSWTSRARAAGRLEAEPDLDRLHRRDGHQRAGQAAVELAVPAHVAAQADRPAPGPRPRPRRPACRRPSWPGRSGATISASTARSSTRISD